ncbi:hypothetical protein DL95DRAFT_466542 [Leptodontidium sp. 2 PMI_412]|nr:hypothetical protein DL95DRAFT_466542 [Leptodontidium sp. 2 PMI_412]
MDRYDKWTESQLQKECLRRGINSEGHKSKLVKRVADDDEEKEQAKPRGVFDQATDPTGAKELAYLNSQTKFDKNYWNSVLGSELEFYEAMVKSKKAELASAMNTADLKHQAADTSKLLAAFAKTTSTDFFHGFIAPTSALENPSQKTDKATVLLPSSEPTQKASTKKLTPQPTTTPKITTTSKTASSPTVIAPAPATKKPYLPMPVIESIFHKAPPSKPPAARKPRAKKAAPEPEPKPAPKKFMTAAGAAYLKSLEGNSDTTDYDQFIAAPSKTKRPNTETEASIAKKLRLNPEQITSPDLAHDRIEKDYVQEDLVNVGYLFLPCEDEKKIRGDTLPFLKNEYRAFAVTEVRADKTGYFMVFEKTAKGDRDLKKCFELIDIEIDDKSFFDKNVTDVKISKRDDAVEEPEPDSEPEPEPEMEVVDLGYTFVPYKKPAPRRGRWGR